MPGELDGGLADVSVCVGEDVEGQEGLDGRLISTSLTVRDDADLDYASA